MKKKLGERYWGPARVDQDLLIGKSKSCIQKSKRNVKRGVNFC